MYKINCHQFVFYRSNYSNSVYQGTNETKITVTINFKQGQFTFKYITKRQIKNHCFWFLQFQGIKGDNSISYNLAQFFYLFIKAVKKLFIYFEVFFMFMIEKHQTSSSLYNNKRFLKVKSARFHHLQFYLRALRWLESFFNQFSFFQ